MSRQLFPLNQIPPVPTITFVYIDGTTGDLLYHMGASYIIAYLRAHGIHAEQFVNDKHLSLQQAACTILAKRPNAVGFTCFNVNSALVQLFTEQIKQLCPGIPIIAGGPTATFSDKELLGTIPGLDICVRGEGEQTTLEIARYLQKGGNLSGIKGITYRQNGTLIRNEDRPLLNARADSAGGLDIIPSPYLTKVLDPEALLKHNRVISISTSRGCVQRCVYCNFSAMSRHTIRYYSLDRIIRELKMMHALAKQGKNFSVHIMDDTFTVDKKRVIALCQRIIRENIHLNFWCQTRADCVNGKVLKLLYKAGIRDINFGLESAVPRILYAMKKARINYSCVNSFLPESNFIKKIKETVKLAKRIGFKVTVNTIFGFPGESLPDGIKTLQFVSNLNVNEYNHNHLKVYPGTELFKTLSQPKSKNVIPSRLANRTLFEYPYSEYDLSTLPRLANESALSDRTAYLRMGDALTGPQGRTTGEYPDYIILTGSYFPFSWAINNLSLQTGIVSDTDLDKRISSSTKPLSRASVRALAALLPLMPRKSSRVSGGLRRPQKTTAYTHKWRSLAAFERSNRTKTSSSAALLTITKRRDAAALRKLLTRWGTGTEGNSLSNNILLDTCRWSETCPALKMRRFFVGDDGAVRPCISGNILCTTAVPLAKAGEKMKKLQAAIEKERGCKNCAAVSRCAKCCFLSEIRPADYCATMKRFAAIGKRLEAARTLDFAAQLASINNK